MGECESTCSSLFEEDNNQINYEQEKNINSNFDNTNLINNYANNSTIVTHFSDKIISYNEEKKTNIRKINYKLKHKTRYVSLLLLGATGDGKSQLGNFILNNPKGFKVSDDIKSETKETRGEYGINGAEDIFVIDTPGLQDTEEEDKKILEQMADYVRNHKSLNAIIIVLNFQTDRLSNYIQDMLKIFINMFPIPNFWDHVSFVFTHYYDEMIKINEKKKPNKIEKFTKLIIELMESFQKIIKDITIPNESNFRFYFVDTEMENLEDKNTNSIDEINRLVGWASSLETFETDKIEKVDNKVISVRYEYDTKKTGSTMKKNIETVYYVKIKRKIEKLYSGKESFNPWEEVDKFTKEIYHEPELVRTDTKWKKEKKSNFICNIEYKTIKHFYKIIIVYNDDYVAESDWIYSHEENEKIVHPKKLFKTETEYKRTYDEKINDEKTLIYYYTFIWSRIKKYFDDFSIEYTDWIKIDTITKIEKRPPYVVKTETETKIETKNELIIDRYSDEELDYYDKIVEKIETKNKYNRKVTYYSDGTIKYGDWICVSTDIYKQYY